jgi:hypothetical protein
MDGYNHFRLLKGILVAVVANEQHEMGEQKGKGYV